jgi:hypothetical protein
MNVSHLKAIIDSLLVKETTLDVQAMLDRLNVASQSLASNPNVAQFQDEFVTQLNALDATLPRMAEGFGSADLRLLAEIGAEPFFLANIANDVRRLAQENAITPTVVHQYVANFSGQRAQYLEALRRLKQGFESLSISGLTVEPGTAEVGFILPRNLFANNLEGLISELGQVKLIIRALAELSTGSVDPIEVKRISTSDPLFVFGVPIVVVALFGKVVKWCLECWKEVEEIRRIRADAERIKKFSTEEIDQIFDKKIKEEINNGISKITENIMEQHKEIEQKRRHELQNHLESALRSIFARIERGMIVEVHAEKPIASENAEQEIEYETEQRLYEDIIANTRGLQFPIPSGNPVLELPGTQNSKSSK